MTNRTITLDDRLYEYLLSVSLREAPILRRLREETSPLPHAGMQIAPEQGQFMALLVRLIGAERTLEVHEGAGLRELEVRATPGFLKQVKPDPLPRSTIPCNPSPLAELELARGLEPPTR